MSIQDLFSKLLWPDMLGIDKHKNSHSWPSEKLTVQGKERLAHKHFLFPMTITTISSTYATLDSQEKRQKQKTLET